MRETSLETAIEKLIMEVRFFCGGLDLLSRLMGKITCGTLSSCKPGRCASGTNRTMVLQIENGGFLLGEGTGCVTYDCLAV